jgi:membrane protein required for colicin V production
MNWVDIIIVIILAIGLFKGLANGFVRGLFGLAAIVLGIMVAAAHYEQVTEVLFTRLQIDPQGQAILGFLLVFVVVMILVTVVGRIISKALKLAALGWIDRLAGGLLGLVMSCLFVGVLLLLVVMAGLETNSGVARSTVAPSVISVMDTVVAFAPDSAREKIEAHYVKLRLEWERARREAPSEEEGEEGETVAFLDPAPSASHPAGVASRGA